MSDSVRPHRRQPTRLPRPWDSPGKNTGMGCHFLFQCIKVKSESEVAQSCPTLSDPMDCSPPGSMRFSRQEYWSGVPLPSPVFDYMVPSKCCWGILCYIGYVNHISFITSKISQFLKHIRLLGFWRRGYWSVSPSRCHARNPEVIFYSHFSF